MRKPIIKCRLVCFVTPKGHPADVFVGHVERCSPHPRLGPDKPGTLTVTSQIVQIDFVHKFFETMNSIYEWGH